MANIYASSTPHVFRTNKNAGGNCTVAVWTIGFPMTSPCSLPENAGIHLKAKTWHGRDSLSGRVRMRESVVNPDAVTVTLSLGRYWCEVLLTKDELKDLGEFLLKGLDK